MKKLLILFSIFLFLNGYVIAAVPNEIRYNGKIKEYREEVNGTRNIKFRIYDALTDGTQKWQSGTQSVNISNGIFSVVLSPNIDWREKDYYIELEVNSKVLSPREKLTAVPYSLHSATSESGSVTATGEYSITVGSDKKLIVNSSGVKEVKGTAEYYMVPKGGIIIWSGAANAIPDGWVLCDGTNGTPDLRGRFVLGYDGTTYNAGDSGGEATHTLTVDEMPSHSHNKGTMEITGKFPACVEQDMLTGVEGAFYMSGTAYEAGGTGHTGNWLLNFQASRSWTGETNSVGGSQPHNNMPPYYTLCYIMKQ